MRWNANSNKAPRLPEHPTLRPVLRARYRAIRSLCAGSVVLVPADVLSELYGQNQPPVTIGVACFCYWLPSQRRSEGGHSDPYEAVVDSRCARCRRRRRASRHLDRCARRREVRRVRAISVGSFCCGATGSKFIFQRVSERRSAGKNRFHIDIEVGDDLHAECDRFIALGAARVSDEVVDAGTRWNTTANPERNVFCLVHH